MTKDHWSWLAAVATVLALATSPPHAAEAPQPAATAAIGKEPRWPVTVQSGATTLTVYTPQLDTWDGHTLTARLAVGASTGRDSPETKYGVVEIAARTLTDKGTRVVTIDEARVTRTDFPAASAADAKRWSDAIARDLTGKSRAIALDRLEAQLEISETVRGTRAEPLRNTPPAIVFSTVPALLVHIDREPAYRRMPDTPFERVINTRPLLLRDAQGTHYLKIFDGWMRAPALTGPWTVLDKATYDLNRAYRHASDARLIDPMTGKSASDGPAPSLTKTVPGIHIATVPTELIVTEGEWRLTAVPGTQLSYVENTTGRVFRTSDTIYVLASGRWFAATTEAGPWTYVAANALPSDFSVIPDDSPAENVKASVAGTAQAREAAVAAAVPQTALVKLAGTALTKPRFDGEPVFAAIPGTPLTFVSNTATPIIRAEERSFYALQDGVWFAAPSVSGPWTVATSVPAVIYTIPPQSPLYYATFVRVYAASADAVYTGYTGGYQGAYIDPETGVVVYGTGYEYDPWLSAAWYGEPITYGYGAALAYTPWSGWMYGYGYGWYCADPMYYSGWCWGGYPYWGYWASGIIYGAAGGYFAWGPGGWAARSGNIYRQWGNRASVSRVAAGYNAWTGNQWASRVGASYNSRTGIASVGQRGVVRNVYSGDYAAGGRGAAAGADKAIAGKRVTVGDGATGESISAGKGYIYDRNTGEKTAVGGVTGPDGGRVGRVGDDIYAGKDGNIYRNTGSGWEQHTPGSGWGPAGSGDRADAARAAAAARSQTSVQDLDNARRARDVGAARSESLRSSSAGMNRGYSGAGGAGGGFSGARGGGGGFSGARGGGGGFSGARGGGGGRGGGGRR